MIDGIRWRTRAGAPWRDVPQRYGSWDRAYDLFRRRQRDGTRKQVFVQLQAAWLARRSAAEVRQGRLQRAPRGGVRDPSSRAPPGCGYEIRQARRPIRGNRAGRSHQRVAATPHTARSMHTS
ncbi:transposase [Streptomyces sp. NPDC058335]|uniref:transposase n=1 Tax=Streptomyces sp. NPDC058335 TaxID=3346451 RepID=UPI00365F5109